MGDASSDESLAALRLRWRYALSLATAGAGFLLVGVLAELFVSYSPGWIVGAALMATGILFGGLSAFVFSTVRQGEERLRRAGVPWRIDRRILGTARRTLTFDQPEYICVGQAFEALKDPGLGLTEVELIRHGAYGVRPATSTGPLDMFVTGLPLGVKVRARRHRTATELRVSVREVTLWRFGPAFQVNFSWVKDAEILIDQVAAAISRRFC